MRKNSLAAPSILNSCGEAFAKLEGMELREKIEAINAIRKELSKYSPFNKEPVDCVQWVSIDKVKANDYNPNSVAPPEMKLLEHSILEDGYTQPVVAWKDGDGFVVIDGFHRNRVGRECKAVNERVNGHLPLAIINPEREGRGDRIASTIRHNRARGKHKVEAMSDIVIELKRRNWSDSRIGKELGMDQDEVLRLCQITGLSDVFKDEEFSRSWDIENDENTTGGEVLSDLAIEEEAEDSKRIFHTWDKWECFKAGFYAEKPPNGITQEEGEEIYRDFLADPPKFEAALKSVTSEWVMSCEHYLTNDRMNRIAWLGQASVAYAMQIPSCCRGGYNKLEETQKQAADAMALKYLNLWLVSRGEPEISYEDALSRTEAELY